MIFEKAKTDTVEMDIARYGVEWFYIMCMNSSAERKYLRKFKDNLGKSGPVVMLILEETTDLIRVYFYLFPDKKQHQRFLKECRYTNYKKQF